MADSYRSIIGKWSSIGEFARDIGVKYFTARQMFERNSIAPQHWLSVVDAAEVKGFRNVTLQRLAEIASLKEPDGRSLPAKRKTKLGQVIDETSHDDDSGDDDD